MTGVQKAKAGGRNSTAVMAQRAPARIEADDPRRRRWRELDYFGTPPWATRAVAEIIHDIDPDARDVWEPACGDGIMAQVLGESFKEVWATDIAPQGFGDEIDFFDIGETRFDWLVTNPPFKHAARFIESGLKKVQRGVAILARLSFIETKARYELHSRFLTKLCPFAERVPMELGPWNPACSSATAYAWFIYEKEKPEGHFSYGPRLRLIEPGTRARLWLPTDDARYGQKTYLPLLDGRA